MIQESTISLLHRISGIIAKYDTIADITGERFNIFNILRLDSNEVKLHSALIAELLNPNGKHGRENLFLNHFLDSLKQTIEGDETKTGKKEDYEKLIEALRTEDVTVKAEKWIGKVLIEDTEGGRIDIIIKTKDGDAIVIENKIYACDQKGQLRRYYKYCTGNLHKEPMVIYLTLNGEAPDNYTTCNDEPCYTSEKINAVTINYKTFIFGWLEKCRKDAVSLPILRETITQYIYLIKQLTHQTTNEFMENEIAVIIAGNEDYIKGAEAVWESQNEIILQIVRKIVIDLKERSEKEKWEFKIEEMPENQVGNNDTGFAFSINNEDVHSDIPNDAPYRIYYYFRNDFNILEVGIEWTSDENPDLENKLRDYCESNLFGERLLYVDWIWGCNFKPWSDTPKWSEKLLKMPEAIIENTRIMKTGLEGFKGNE